MNCIFCKQDSSSSKSAEHIIPEAIGNKRRVLPPGVVCDKCNNYFSRKVEKPILEHSSMRNLRAWYQVPNKKGKYPALQGHIGGTDITIGLRRDQDGRIKLEAERSRDSERLRKEIEGGFSNSIIFKIEMNPPKREMSRFLCKMALETAAATLNTTSDSTEMIVREPFYENVRNYARYGTNYSSWPYSQRRIFPEDTLMQHPVSGEWVRAGFGCGWFMNKRRETLFAFFLYGTEFVINVGGPSILGFEEWLEDHGGISPLVERLGCYLTSEGSGRAKSFRLHGSFDSRKGIEFDKNHGYLP